ncbi:MAG: GAF domain-containing protein [Phenylobacterium sp.]|uniref:GAF domain-containing protein n=1 Tax=Phenylobacterium sp. TaxID=1871053 RepID=UPI002734D1AD|nr:GAF domain-containing protein [Phenylobacterium sp.]MDP3747059.1 GAF domain-containing protein [Phenylobacterium sp.]
MSMPLSTIRDCLEGVIPSIVATLDAAGTPNVSYLSQVYLVDETHVALSNQFFSKTVANVKATGRAAVVVVDGRTGQQYALDLAYERSLGEGEIFERMAAQLKAISSQHAVGEVMALRSADLYRVLDCRKVPGAAVTTAAKQPDLAHDGERLALAARLAAAVAAQSDADGMIDRTLDGLTRDLGFANVMVLSLDEGAPRLTTLASRGYAVGGVGSEVALGDGSIGIAAATLRAVRLSDMSRGRRFAEAVRDSAEIDAARFIPLPGLVEPQSQLAAPMISRGKAMGVLFAESPERFGFTGEDEDALTLIGAQLAASLRLAELESRETASAVAPPSAGAGDDLGAGSFRVRSFSFDDSVFIDDAYLIKGVPGRLLFHLLQVFVETGRRDFTNREIRLEPSLRLPDLKDNLETRLILLRRRLDEKAAPVRLIRPGRGQIRLEIQGTPRLEMAGGG